MEGAMTKASPERVRRKMEEKQSKQEQPEQAIPPDCGYCLRANNCMVWNSFVGAVQQGLGNPDDRIKGIKLVPKLHIQNCPEFNVDPEVEPQLREQLAQMPQMPEPDATPPE
jgi:hypothetical protein